MTYPEKVSVDGKDLFNGEREIGTIIKDFPADHLNRYFFARSLIRDNASVLDVGCGVGYGSYLLAEYAKHVTSIDYRPDVISFAKDHWHRENQSYICGDALAQESYPTGQFDLITAYEIIEHLANDKQFLEILVSKLAPMGILCVSAPNLEIMRHPEDNPWHYRHYLPEQFFGLLREYLPHVAEFTQPNPRLISPGRHGYTNIAVAYRKWYRTFKIGFVSQEYPSDDTERYPPSGGIGTYTHTIARALAKQGHEVHVICKARKNDQSHMFLEDDIYVHRLCDEETLLDKLPSRWQSGGAPAVYNKVLKRALAVSRFLQNIKFDLIEYADWQAEMLFTSRRISNEAWIVRLHTPSYIIQNASKISIDLRYQLMSWLEKLNAQRADRVTSPSQALANQVQRDWRLNNIDLISNPVIPMTEYGAKPSSHVQSDKRLLVGYFPGRFDRLKGFPILADALHRFLAIDHSNMNYILVGKNYTDREGQSALVRLEPWIKQDDSSHQPITLLPRQSYKKLSEIANTVDAVIITSHYENAPYVILEAMARGQLVIAPRVGGIPEIIDDGQTGLLYSPADVDDLVRCLNSLAQDTLLVTKIRRNAVSVIRDFYSNNLIDTYLVYYAHVIGSRNQGIHKTKPFGWWLPGQGPLLPNKLYHLKQNLFKTKSL